MPRRLKNLVEKGIVAMGHQYISEVPCAKLHPQVKNDMFSTCTLKQDGYQKKFNSKQELIYDTSLVDGVDSDLISLYNLEFVD